MAVTLSGLPCLSPFDCIGEPATLGQRWDKWKAEFELYVAASWVEDKKQMRALLETGRFANKSFRLHPGRFAHKIKVVSPAMKFQVFQCRMKDYM